MKLIRCGFLLILAFGVMANSARAQLRAQKNWRDVEPEAVMLLPYAKYRNTFKGNGKSGFSFRYGVRGEVAPEITGGSELLYGNIIWNGDSDWFTVRLTADDRSRIKDLGEMKWPEILEVPLLPASAKPHGGAKAPSRTETYEQSSGGQITKVVAGHMYVVHAKNSRADFYALFRVEKLVPGDQVTISWKLVPSPKR
jgi:hypothetical protein